MLIIDTNALNPTFDPANARHKNYAEIRSFILKGRGILVAGGTTYLKELRCLPKIVKIFSELGRVGQLVTCDRAQVDDHEARIRGVAPEPHCDDQHLIALVSVSRARVIATDDKRADKYLRDRALYPVGVKRPSIYRSPTHRRLLLPLPKVEKR